MTELETLTMICNTYGAFIDAAAKLHRHRPEVLAGIMMRETEGGTSKYLDIPGPAGRGDMGHGHGLMQIDNRSFEVFCHSQAWKDPDQNIHFGAWVLKTKRMFLAPNVIGYRLNIEELERAAIAAYNCGEGRVLKLIEKKVDVDMLTAHHNYSQEVLRFAEIYRGIGIRATA